MLWLGIAGSGHAFAQTWTQVSSPNTNWNYIVSSANGTTLACTPYPLPFSTGRTGPGLIYISTNSGTSWTACPVGSPATGNWYWTYLAMSADGTWLVAESNNFAIYSSTNTGTSWAPILKPSSGAGPIAASADGNHLYVADLTSHIYTSTNCGQTWTTNLSPLTSASGLTSMVCSADGHSVFANYEFSFILSTNFGLSWTNITSHVSLSEDRYVGCASADGSILTIQADGGAVISTNSGINWSLNDDNQNPGHTDAAACSADGSKLIVSQDSPGGIYLSTNTGTTWQYFTNAGTEDYLIAASADGCQIAASSTNGIYLLQSVPSPKLNLMSSATNLTLTWTVPSTNFALQQSSDLVNWNNLTNAPELDPSQVENQISLPLSNGNAFYRLATQ